MNAKNSALNIFAEAKKDYQLHVALLQRLGFRLADARVKAWLDGPKGLKEILPTLQDIKETKHVGNDTLRSD